MNWATEPEEDRDLVEQGARVFLRALAGVLVAVALALYAVMV